MPGLVSIPETYTNLPATAVLVVLSCAIYAVILIVKGVRG
jgi:hypothetical protein